MHKLNLKHVLRSEAYITSRCTVTVTVTALSPETQMKQCASAMKYCACTRILSSIGLRFSLGCENHIMCKLNLINLEEGRGQVFQHLGPGAHAIE